MFYIKISNFLEVILSTAVVKIIPRWYDSRCLYAASVSELEILTEGRYNLRYSLAGVSEFVSVTYGWKSILQNFKHKTNRRKWA